MYDPVISGCRTSILCHMKAAPGRKTDVKDAEWIADLLQHGLLHPSYIPNKAQCELRELVRYRKSLAGSRRCWKVQISNFQVLSPISMERVHAVFLNICSQANPLMVQNTMRCMRKKSLPIISKQQKSRSWMTSMVSCPHFAQDDERAFKPSG